MSNSVKQYIYNLKWLVAIVVFALCIGFVGESSLVNRYEQQKEIARLLNDIAEQNRKFVEDSIELVRLKTDPDALAEVARERYLMKTEDEDIFVIRDED